jgi:hypothetical protein
LEDTSITKATILRAAWAMVLARYCDTNDITFGTAVSGRQSSVPGVERMIGPTVATVPVRVQLDRSKPVAEFLRDLQIQASEMVPYEQYGLRNIARLSETAKEACDFTSLMVIQPAQMTDPNDADAGAVPEGAALLPVKQDDEGRVSAMAGYFNYPLVVQCIVYASKVKISLTYDAAVLTEFQLKGVMSRFEHVLPQLAKQPAKKSKRKGKGDDKRKRTSTRS